MRPIVVILLFVLQVISTNGLAQNGKLNRQVFRLQGTGGNFQFPLQSAVLTYTFPDGPVKDSVVVRSGKFQFKRKLQEPLLSTIRIYVDSTSTTYLAAVVKPRKILESNIFLNNEAIKISLDSSGKIIVQTADTHTEYLCLQELQRGNFTERNKLFAEYGKFARENNEDGKKSLTPLFNQLNERIKAIYLAYVLDHPSSPVSLFAFGKYAEGLSDPDSCRIVFSTLSSDIRKLPSAKLIEKRITDALNIKVGMEARDFTQPDVNGTLVSLSSYKGKYVLLDFWASWCVPCRQESPNLVKEYMRYKDKGFTILSVSLDRSSDKSKWLKAIAADQLQEWTHVSDLQFMDNAAAKLYAVEAIPQNFLVSPEGKIIAINLRGEQLGAKLLELFGK